MGGTDGPGNMALGALDDPEETYELYSMMGRDIRAFGANIGYAPELDLVAGPEAAWVFTKGFGETGELVGRHAAAAVQGVRCEQILGAMKHFPGGGRGHGDGFTGDLHGPGRRVSRQPVGQS